MKTLFLTIAVLASILLTRCYYDSDERINYDVPTGNSLVCNADSVTYTTCVKPIIDVNCKNCHGGTHTYGSIKLDTYANVKLNYSVSMNDVKNGKMPTSGKLPDSEIKTLTDWGTQGQKE